jgi:hypothetical protein
MYHFGNMDYGLETIKKRAEDFAPPAPFDVAFTIKLWLYY